MRIFIVESSWKQRICNRTWNLDRVWDQIVRFGVGVPLLSMTVDVHMSVGDAVGSGAGMSVRIRVRHERAHVIFEVFWSMLMSMSVVIS